MKNKRFAILLLLILIVLVSCGGHYDSGEDVPGKNYSGNPFAEYWADIILDSYSDMLYASEISSQSGITHDNVYIINKGVGSYKTIYYFTAPDSWIVPTSNIEKYFSNVRTASLESYLFDTSSEYCSCGNHDLFENLSFFDKLKYYQIQKYPYIEIVTSPLLIVDDAIIEIEDITLLEMTCNEGDSGYRYHYSYLGVNVFEIYSCSELSQSELEEVLGHIVIWR